MAGVKGSGCGLKPGQKALVGAGRKKGTPNKNVDEIRQIFQRVATQYGKAHDWNPIEEMTRIGITGLMEIWDPETQAPTGKFGLVDLKSRCRMLEEISQYGYSKRKAVELQDPDGNSLNLGLAIEFVQPKGE